MVILFGKTGQLCNRLFNLSSFIANAKENKYGLKILYFSEYYQYFEDINEKLLPYRIEIKFDNTLFAKINYKFISNQRRINHFIKIFGLNYSKTGDINDPKFINMAQQNRLFVSGWPYWDVENFIKYSDHLRHVFAPKKEILEKYNDIISGFKEEYDILVGVHIRQGDYKEFMGGKYYFETNDYCKIISTFNNDLMSKGCKPIFLICSNGNVKIENTDFKYYISRNNAIEDIVLLSKCNFIFGPPSTFSMWSSFFGKVPLKIIFHKNEVLKEDDFSEIVAPNTFKNGENISKL